MSSAHEEHPNTGGIGVRPAWLAAVSDATARVSQRAMPQVKRAGGWAFKSGRWSIVPLLAGLLGSLAAVIVMIALRLLVGTPTLPELVGERVLPLMSAGQFVQLLIRFGPNSHTYPLFYTLLGQIAVGVLIGPAWALAARSGRARAQRWPERRAWLAAGAFALSMEALALILFWPVLFQNLFGYTITAARWVNFFATLLVFAVFMVVVALADYWLRRSALGRIVMGERPHPPTPSLVREPRPRTEASFAARPARRGGEHNGEAGDALAQPVSRRAALGTVGIVALGVGVGALATRELIGAYLARSNYGYEGMETEYAVSQATQITPTQDFYVVSKNLLDPTVVVNNWRLEITGMVHNPRSWTYAEALKLPSETRAVTMECIANGPGGHLLSTARWTGFTLARAIAEAGGATPQAKYVVFSSVDGYVSSLPLADLLQARSLLVYKMNGATLPDAHGYPLRAIVPGRYGEQSPKWLTRIELSDHPTKGFYQSQGWYDGQIHTTSRIERPKAAGKIPLAPVTVGGLAYAGIRGVKRVEISADAGLSWSDATLVPPLSDQTAVYWTWQWTPPAKGQWTLVARATDGTGAVQTPTETSTVPNGSTGWHYVTVTVG